MSLATEGFSAMISFFPPDAGAAEAAGAFFVRATGLADLTAFAFVAGLLVLVDLLVLVLVATRRNC